MISEDQLVKLLVFKMRKKSLNKTKIMSKLLDQITEEVTLSDCHIKKYKAPLISEMLTRRYQRRIQEMVRKYYVDKVRRLS